MLKHSIEGFLGRVTAVAALVVSTAVASDTLELSGEVGPAPDYPIIGFHMTTGSVHSKSLEASGDGGVGNLEVGSSFC